MSDVLLELQAIKAKTEEVGRLRAKAEAEIDVLKVRLRENIAFLKSEFEVDSIEAATARLAEREAELEVTIRSISERLPIS